jgi:uncharacterized membrane protein
MRTRGRQAWSAERVAMMLGNVLRVGVLLSAAIITLGGVIYLVRNGHDIVDYHAFKGEPVELRTVPGIVAAAFSFSGPGLVQLGLLSLIATPIARVVFSVIGFFHQRDWLYVGITSVVLALLFYSLLGGAA